MSWDEFSTLLSGLNHKTPLGAIVAIRAETDNEIIKNFTPEQKRIRSEWLAKEAKAISEEEFNASMLQLEEVFRQFGSKN